MKKSPGILLHKEELDGFGVDLEPIDVLPEPFATAHRDDHYMFILQQKGQFVLEIDFKETKLKDASVCFVTPGQVHKYIKWKQAMGRFIFADVSLVPEQYREIFDAYQHVRQAVAVKTDALVFKSIPILEQLIGQEQSALNKLIVANQVGVIAGMVASAIIQSQSSGHTINGQRYRIANRFKQLIRNNYKDIKQVQEYAALLAITPLHLNEVVKEITGFPASYWIQQEIILEAKRLLYYTTLDVKQVAYELGYEDHAYFSRFFKKNTGITALAFRIKNHDLSNHSH